MDIPSYLLGKKAGGGKGNLKYVVVDELPTTGEDNTIYLVPKTTSGTNNYYDEYMYIDSNWELIGDTEVDLSSKQDVMQFATMPTANADNLGKIVQYVGTSVANSYTNGYFYKCVSDGQSPATYSWEQTNVQDGASYTAGTNIEITNAGVINNTIPYKQSNSSAINYRGEIFGDGSFSSSDVSGATGIGKGSYVASSCVAIGHSSRAEQNSGIAIGYAAKARRSSCIALGTSANVLTPNTMEIGSDAMRINHSYVWTSSGRKELATQDYVTQKAYQLAGLSEYSASSTYAVGDYVYYNNLIYKCNTAISSAEAWDSTHWTQKTYMEYMSDVLIGSALGGSY